MHQILTIRIEFMFIWSNLKWDHCVHFNLKKLTSEMLINLSSLINQVINMRVTTTSSKMLWSWVSIESAMFAALNVSYFHSNITKTKLVTPSRERTDVNKLNASRGAATKTILTLLRHKTKRSATFYERETSKICAYVIHTDFSI